MQLAALVELHITPDSATITAGESRLDIPVDTPGSAGALPAELRAAVAALAFLRRRCGVELYCSPDLAYGAVTYLNRPVTSKPLKLRDASLWAALHAVAGRHDIQWHRPLRPRESIKPGCVGSTVLIGRTKGEGVDVGYLYSDATTSPWDGSLGEYRLFSETERASELGCITLAEDCARLEATSNKADVTAIPTDELVARLSRRLARKTFTLSPSTRNASAERVPPSTNLPTSTKATSTSCNPHLPPPMTIALAS